MFRSIPILTLVAASCLGCSGSAKAQQFSSKPNKDQRAVPVHAQAERVNKPAAEKPASSADQMRAEAEKFVAAEVAKLANLKADNDSAAMDKELKSQAEEDRRRGEYTSYMLAWPDKAERLIEKNEEFVSQVADGTDDAKKKLVAAVRGMKGEKLSLKVPSRPGSAFDPAAMLTDINTMVSEVYATEQQYRRDAITEDQRDLDQGKAVASVVGLYGGRAVGGLIGAYIGGMVAGPAGAGIGGTLGTTTGGRIGETVMVSIAKSFEKQTRAVTRAIRHDLNVTGDVISGRKVMRFRAQLPRPVVIRPARR